MRCIKTDTSRGDPDLQDVLKFTLEEVTQMYQRCIKTELIIREENTYCRICNISL